MLDVGFSEILLTSAIALIVLGPERLPKVARQVGNWVGRERASVERAIGARSQRRGADEADQVEQFDLSFLKLRVDLRLAVGLSSLRVNLDVNVEHNLIPAACLHTARCVFTGRRIDGTWRGLARQPLRKHRE